MQRFTITWHDYKQALDSAPEDYRARLSQRFEVLTDGRVIAKQALTTERNRYKLFSSLNATRNNAGF